MLQALIKKGRALPVEVPAPMISSGSVLIKVVNSCISAGTELSDVQTSGKSLIRKAFEQPENVKKVPNMARSEGIAKTIVKLHGKLETGSPTGYSLSGIVVGVGDGVTDIQPGDRLAAAGAGLANHAEFVDVPRNLVIPIPDGLGFKEASTVTLGGIAMQAVRRAQLQFGEFAVVFGAGILGQLALQMLRLGGARVIAVDLDRKRLDLAKNMGAELCLNPNDADYITSLLHHTNGHGADVVIFCASTNDPQVLSDAFGMTRKKGRVVMLGVWGSELRREDVYTKELDFLVSTSYGPGRYDPNYEERGLDYPYAYVRWTENRNMQEYLRMLTIGEIRLEPLIKATYPLAQVEQAFASLQGPDKPLLAILDYGRELPKDFFCLVQQRRQVTNHLSYRPVAERRIRVGIIGAGAFANSVHLPNLKKLNKAFKIQAICNRTGHKAQAVAEQLGAKYTTTAYQEIVSDPDVDLVLICTRHNLHGPITLESLEAGKHTFVEKPLCVTQEELDAIKEFYSREIDLPFSANIARPLLMVGFNRRFSKYAHEIKKHISKRINPLFLHYRMNAGHIPLDHWVHTEEGGGRIIGEACHIIDLFSFFVENPVKALSLAKLRPKPSSIYGDDNTSIILEYEDGSVGTLEYFAIGSKKFPKEYLEVHFDEKTIVVDDYKSIQGFGIQVADIKTRFSEKGQVEELEVLAKCLSKYGKMWPIPLESILETTEMSFRLAQG